MQRELSWNRLSAGDLALIEYEQDEKLVPYAKQERWHEYLWGRLTEGPGYLRENQLHVLTYNYDRSFEWFLFRSVRATFGLSGEETAEYLSDLPVVHLHGQLGRLPFLADDGVRKYDPTVTPDIIGRVAPQVKIIHDPIDNDPEFQEAHSLLSKAEAVGFLGFGFHPMNIKRLRLNEILRKDALLYGTAHDLYKAERERAIRRVGRHIDFVGLKDSCLIALKELPLLV